MTAARRAGVLAVLREIRAPLSVYAPVLLLLLVWSLLAAPALPAIPLNAFAGLLLWTGMEYIIHRFVLHLVPRGRVRRFLAGRHVLHHRSPSEHPGLIAARVSLPIAIAFFAAGAWLFGSGIAASLALGVISGYLLYEYTHMAIHQGSASLTPWGDALVRHHRLHHEGHAAANFAILVPPWDALWHTRVRGHR